MSLEQVIVELNTNIVALNALLQLQASGEAKTTTPRAARKPAATEQTQPVGQPSAENASPLAQTAAAQQPAASTASKIALTYDHVKALILKLSPLNRTATLQVLADHGVTKGPELKQEQYESAHKALSEELAKAEAAAAAAKA